LIDGIDEKDLSARSLNYRDGVVSRFDGKVAIVTGAASGIGNEIALRLTALSGTPVIADRDRGAPTPPRGSTRHV
jgi:hypothetical protein